MKKDKEWLKERILESSYKSMGLYTNNSVVSTDLVIHYIDQLDEPENEENFYTFDNAKKWLQDNGFVVFEKDKLDEEVQRMVDEAYDATNEKPVVPQFVAEYIEQSKKDNDSINQVFAFIDDKENKKLWNWLFPSMYEEKRANQEVFMRAWLDGYEVEKEKKYIIKFAPSVFGTSTYGSIGTHNGKKIMQSVYGSQEGLIVPNQYTRREIEEVGSKYMIFAEEITE